jgi:hypothetical protein
MKNEKLENAKSKIVEFYDKHETAIKIGVGVTTLVGFVGWAVYCGKKHPVISGVSGVVDAQGPDDKCVIFGRDALLVMFDRTQRDELLNNIKNDGCSVTQDGLEILKAVIDNPVIVDR